MKSDVNTVASSDCPHSITWCETLTVVVLAVVLTVVFWEPLWTGGGLIGGDTYTYFFPQKQFFAERLHDGEFPLWNNRSGFGYPLIAESQTGAFYPLHLLIYPLLDVNEGYNVVQLVHYVLAFIFTWLLAREFGLKPFGAILAALIYVYGWFSPRMCLEWAVIGGTWLPLLLWWLERFLKTSQWRYASGLSVTIGVQLLAGHFNLAFITLSLLVLLLVLRLCYWKDGLAESIAARRMKHAGLIFGFLAIGFGIAAAQLAPTWELKQLSQRQNVSEGPDFDPAYGHIPPLYLSQIVASWWFWYSGDIDLNQALGQLTFLASPAATNFTEAHLYFGLTPLIVLAVTLASARYRGSLLNRFTVSWLLVSIAGIIYATGLLVPVAQQLPGFGFFRGPGRWGILAALGVGLIAGKAAGSILRGRSRLNRIAIASVIFVLTAFDLWYVSRAVAVVALLEQSPLPNIEHSPVKKILDDYPGMPRLYGPGPNLLNLLGHSSVPEYLGIGPAEYYDENLKAPPYTGLTPEFVSWCRRSGITHVVSFDNPQIVENFSSRDVPGTRLLWQRGDPFLNPSWARGFNEPIYLTEILNSRRRVSFENDLPGQSIDLILYNANSATIKTSSPDDSTAIMTDLYFPGWEVTIDGEPTDGYRFEGLFRAVDVPAGEHTIEWSYHPGSVRTGLWISVVSVIALMVIGHVRFWHFSPKASARTT